MIHQPVQMESLGHLLNFQMVITSLLGHHFSKPKSHYILVYHYKRPVLFDLLLYTLFSHNKSDWIIKLLNGRTGILFLHSAAVPSQLEQGSTPLSRFQQFDSIPCSSIVLLYIFTRVARDQILRAILNTSLALKNIP